MLRGINVNQQEGLAPNLTTPHLCSLTAKTEPSCPQHQEHQIFFQYLCDRESAKEKQFPWRFFQAILYFLDIHKHKWLERKINGENKGALWS